MHGPMNIKYIVSVPYYKEWQFTHSETTNGNTTLYYKSHQNVTSVFTTSTVVAQSVSPYHKSLTSSSPKVCGDECFSVRIASATVSSVRGELNVCSSLGSGYASVTI